MSRSVQAERMRVRWSWVEFGEVGKGVQPKVRTEGCWWTEEPFSAGDTTPRPEQELLWNRPGQSIPLLNCDVGITLISIYLCSKTSISRTNSGKGLSVKAKSLLHNKVGFPNAHVKKLTISLPIFTYIDTSV